MTKHAYSSLGRCKLTGRVWGGACLALLALLPIVHALSFQTPIHREFKITTNVELVLLDASVKDPKGGYVAGLPKDAFHVFENGIPQKLTVFSSSDEPVTVGLVLDDSGSMNSKRDQVITAGLGFIGASNPLDQTFVVNFNDKVRSGLPPEIPFSDQLAVLHAALSRNRAEGQTALYDAIVFALRHLEKGQRDKKTLVVVSDGGDNCSKHTLAEVMKMIQESRATIYTVGLFDADDPDSNPGVLKRIANASGGEWFLPKEIEEIGPICTRIAKDIRARYTIGYSPDRDGDKAGVRKIKVVVSAPNRDKLIVRTRPGYSLPEAPDPDR